MKSDRLSPYSLRLQLYCYFGFILLYFCQICLAADLAIQIPGNLGLDGSFYRLDYSPPYGNPSPNTTIASRDIGDVIMFSEGLPGTKYEFWLYYSNSTLVDWLTWTASITTAPDPPTNLSVQVHGGKSAQVSWSPPAKGQYSHFKLKVLPLSEVPPPNNSVVEAELGFHYSLQNLTPGASYQVQLFTVYDGKESVAYTSRNFTTKPNTPGKFIVWFRNETTLLVLWQPPYPAGIFAHYRVSIEPQDSPEHHIFVEKEGEPPGPAQAAFKGLTPGRAYNISVQTVSDDEFSAPTTAQYRTVPLRPMNVTFDKNSITSRSFRVQWEPPKGVSEFDKYQILIGLRRPSPVSRLRSEPTTWEFKENLDPGRTYQVVVKTVSGKVTSWPATGNVTLKPLPVTDLNGVTDERTGLIKIDWTPDNSSFQESYKITTHEVETSYSGDINTVYTYNTSAILEQLLPGRNYSITVQSVSSQMESNETTIYMATRPLSPIIEDLRPIPRGLNISWKSDVKTRQDKFEVIYSRNDTGENVTTVTTESRLVLVDLYPGAGYDVKVYAISHGLRSEPHEDFQAVYPHPPRNLTIEKVTSNSVLVRWEPPEDSIFSEYSIRYRTEEDKTWDKLPPVKVNEAEVADMTPGEKYLIQVNTVSFGVESNIPQEVNHTVRPNPVSNIALLVDSNNVTLEWPRPEGRIEYYIVQWQAEGEEKAHRKNISESTNEREGRPVRVLIGDLMPGVNYTFQIHTVSYGLESDIIILSERTMPLIQSEVVVVNNPQVTDSITLRYTPTPQTSSRFDSYRFMLSDSSVYIKEKSASDADMKVTFNDLKAGQLYNITVWTVSGGKLSQPLQRQDRLYPVSISSLNSTMLLDTMITLVWQSPDSYYTDFQVSYLNTEGVLINNFTGQTTIVISELKPHWNYTFTVTVRAGTETSMLRLSLPFSAVFTTRESVPGKVEKFHPEDIQPSEITFSWMLPSNEQNGVILKYSITYGLEGSAHAEVMDFKPNEFRGTIKNLKPGKTFTFHIQAETRIGFGPEATWKQTMPILAPPKPESQVVPTEVCRSSTTIQIRFRKKYFSDKNGPVKSYAIIVAEDNSKNASGLEMPSWRDVQAYSIWPPFQVMDPYYPFTNSSVEDFTIGTEHCEVRGTGYCNGPLKSGSTYRVKVRAFTAPDKFTDTAYSFPIQTDQDNTPIIVGVTVPLALLLLLLLVVILLRRRRTSNRRATETRGNDNLSLPDSIIETRLVKKGKRKLW